MGYWEDIAAEDFKDDMSLLVNIVGLDAAKRIVEAFGGDSVYIPKAESLVRQGRDRQIYQEFQNDNYKELAQKYNLTPRHVRVIIRSQRMKNSKDPARQLELFGGEG